MTDAPRPRVNWRAVAIYYVVACGVSWPFFWWRDMHGASFWAFARTVPWFVPSTLIMGGPAVGAVIVLFVLRLKPHVRRITLLGHAPWHSLALWFATCTIWVIAGVPGVSRIRALEMLVIGSATNMLGEELGWRGFLQDALHPLPRIRRYIVLGAMWELWHFTNRWSGGPVQIAFRLMISYPMVMLLAAAIGAAVERTRAVVIGIAIHFTVDLALEMGGGQLGDEAPVRAAIGFAACVVLWIVAIRRWPDCPPDLPRVSSTVG